MNQEETLAAREKQKRIKEAFRSWVFADPERTERLVRIYNDTYNNLRLAGLRRLAPRIPRDEPDHLAPPAPEGRHLAGDVGRQHAPRPRRRGREDLHDGRHRHEAKGRGAFTKAALRRAEPHAGAVRPGVSAALPEREAARRDQGGPRPRAGGRSSRRRLPAPSGTASSSRIRASSESGCRGSTRRGSCGSRLPSTTSSSSTAPGTRTVPTGTSSRPSRSRRPDARSGSKSSSPRTRRTTAWSSTSWGSITYSSTRPTISRTSKPRPRWSGSRASRPAGASGRSTST